MVRKTFKFLGDRELGKFAVGTYVVLISRCSNRQQEPLKSFIGCNFFTTSELKNSNDGVARSTKIQSNLIIGRAWTVQNKKEPRIRLKT